MIPLDGDGTPPSSWEPEDIARSEIDAIVAELAELASSSDVLVCGPWLSEVGFELLYWIPFLRRLVKRHGIDPKRLIVISRGGAAPWYSGLCGQYVDVLDDLSPAEVKTIQEERRAETGTLKQVSTTRADEELVRRLLERRGIAYDRILHPSLMYRLFRGIWTRRAPMSVWLEHTAYLPLRAEGSSTHGNSLEFLPKSYVAVKIYFSDSFPDNERNREFSRSLVADVARSSNVVLLSTGIGIDDHVDFTDKPGRRIVSIDRHIEPRTNLALQTDVVRRSRGLVATYGGFSYLGPLVGIPTLSFASSNVFNPTHLDVANRVQQRLGKKLGAGELTLVGTEQLALIRNMLGAPTLGDAR